MEVTKVKKPPTIMELLENSVPIVGGQILKQLSNFNFTLKNKSKIGSRPIFDVESIFDGFRTFGAF